MYKYKTFSDTLDGNGATHGIPTSGDLDWLTILTNPVGGSATIEVWHKSITVKGEPNSEPGLYFTINEDETTLLNGKTITASANCNGDLDMRLAAFYWEGGGDATYPVFDFDYAGDIQAHTGYVLIKEEIWEVFPVGEQHQDESRTMDIEIPPDAKQIVVCITPKATGAPAPEKRISDIEFIPNDFVISLADTNDVYDVKWKKVFNQ